MFHNTNYFPPLSCPFPRALSLACTNPFVVDWGAQALAELSALEELVHLSSACKPSCPAPDQAYLLLLPPTSSLLFCPSPWITFLSHFACFAFSSPSSPCRVKFRAGSGELEEAGRNMHLWSNAPFLLLLCLLEAKGHELGHMQQALTALKLPLETEEPQLQKNHTSILIAKILQVVHCAERTGTSQDNCDKVGP